MKVESEEIMKDKIMPSEAMVCSLKSSMPYGAQATLKLPVTFEGIGTHGGQPVTMILHPAEVGKGIVFVRSDVQGQDNKIPALWNFVSDTRMCTKITNEAGVSVSTIEHLLSALYACDLDSVRIEINGPEVPIMDGSAQEFIAPLLNAGRTFLDQPRSVIAIKRPVVVRESEDRWVSIEPADRLYIECKFDFNGRANFPEQTFKGEITPDKFISAIAPARTFGFVEDVMHLRSMGLAKGSSLENAVGIQDNRILNPEGLRFEDEFVRHKVLDIVGDLFTAGFRIHGHLVGTRTGHALSNQLLRAVFADESNWVIQ